MPSRDEGTFLSKNDKTQLFWQWNRTDSAPKASIALVHGYGEYSERYRATIDAWTAQGFEVMGLDYRGHGHAAGKRGDCLRWELFLDDLETFWDKFQAEARSSKRFIVAHSHGALMATHFVLRQPAGLTGVVLSGAYYKLAFDPPALTLLGAKLIKGILPGVSISNQLAADQLSRDPAWQAKTNADPLYIRSTTPRWFFEHMAWQSALAGTGARFTAPVFMVMGEADPIASPAAAKAYFDTIASADKTWRAFPGMRHEVMNELGKEEVVGAIAQWISAHC